MPYSDNQLLRDAVARNAGVVVSLPSAGIVRHHKSRFLAECEEGIWVEVPRDERALVGELIISQQSCGISFRNGANKSVFTVPILRHDPEYRINAEITVEAALVACPVNVKTIQRRTNYRVQVPQDAELRVRVWRIGPGVPVRDRPMAKQELKAKLRNISLGGVGVILEGTEEEPVKVSTEDRLRILLTGRDVEMVLEGRLRYPKEPGMGLVRAGIQFKSLDKDIDGRQALATLTRMVGELTRAELRRLRIGTNEPTPEAA